MYITEFIYNLVRKIIKEKNVKNNKTSEEQAGYNFETDNNVCEHVFLPIDSTQEILACTKCGKIIKRRELYGKNFFTNENS